MGRGSCSSGQDTRSSTGTLTDSEVSVINADGTGQVQLTNNDVPNSHPVWSPDGTKILYSDGTPFFGGDDRLHILNPDGSGDVALPFGGQSPDWGFRPRWRP
jgi:Tol biopolymer transport system component